MPEPITSPLPKPDKPRSLVERVYVGTSKVVKHRYEHHLETFVKKRVIPQLSGLPEEIAAHMRPRLELAARRAAVGRTTAEVTGVVAALVGTVLLVKKAIDSRAPGALRQSKPNPLSAGPLPTYRPDELISIDKFPWTAHVDPSITIPVGNVAAQHLQLIAPHVPNALGEVPPFHEVVRDLYSIPLSSQDIAALGNIRKTDSTWRAQFRDVMAKHFHRVFEQFELNYPDWFAKWQPMVLNALESAEATSAKGSATGFLDHQLLGEHTKRIAKHLSQAAY